MVADKTSAFFSALDQFVTSAKLVEDTACAEVINQALEASGVYVFGALLEVPNVKKLATTHSTYFNTLNLFAYGTYKDYLANPSNFIPLSPVQKKKLQHLTIITLVTKMKCIPYATLFNELEIKNTRDLEDLIIEAIYADIILGKLDQKHRQLEIDCAIGRDIRPGDVNSIINCLTNWCSACEKVLSCVETQISRANSDKNASNLRQVEIAQEISNLKKSLKTQIQDKAEGTDEPMIVDSRDINTNEEKTKKVQKNTKGLSLWKF